MNEIFQFTARELGDHPRPGAPGVGGPRASHRDRQQRVRDNRFSRAAHFSGRNPKCHPHSVRRHVRVRWGKGSDADRTSGRQDDQSHCRPSRRITIPTHTHATAVRAQRSMRQRGTCRAQAVELTMQQRNHRMPTSSPEAPMWVQADAARLEQALVNLLINAAKYTDPGGQFGLIVAREDGEAVIRVRDNGIGTDPEVLPHVFDLFVQANPSSRRTDAGLGIGLALGAQRGQSPRRSCYRVKRRPRVMKRVCDPFASACAAADRSGVGADRCYPHLAAQQIVGLRSEQHCRGDSGDRGRSAPVGPAIAARCRTIRSSAVPRRQTMNSQPPGRPSSSHAEPQARSPVEPGSPPRQPPPPRQSPPAHAVQQTRPRQQSPSTRHPPAGPQGRSQEGRIAPQDHRQASGPGPKDQDRNNESAPGPEPREVEWR